MLHSLRWLAASIAALVVLSLSAVQAEEKDEMVPNPRYVHWANCKPGSTVTHIEKTTYADPATKLLAPDGIDEKEITYKLLSVSPDKVVVETVVVEKDFLSNIEQAPTKITFPAKIRKSHLETVLREAGAKPGEETVNVLGKDLKCKTLTGDYKESGDDIHRQVCYTDAVPGGIVKQTRVTKHDGKMVAETVVTVKAYKKE
jgi:hypothetical protein